MSQEHEHDFDGIEEQDNPLPGWWLSIFWVTIGIAIFYVPYYHFMNPEKLPRAALAADLAARETQLQEAEAAAQAQAEAAAAEAEAKGEVVLDEEAALQAKMDAGGWLDAAKANFATYCVPCHLSDGGGSIGPNFTDNYSIHGGKLTQIRHVITEGVPAKGMVPWKLSLKPDQIEELSFYIKSLRGTTPAVAKAPEGQLMDEAGNLIDGDAPAADEPSESSGAPN